MAGKQCELNQQTISVIRELGDHMPGLCFHSVNAALIYLLPSALL